MVPDPDRNAKQDSSLDAEQTTIVMQRTRRRRLTA
jgi:hypothetical protein